MDFLHQIAPQPAGMAVALMCSAVAMLAGCTTYVQPAPAPRVVYVTPAPAPVYTPAPQEVVSVYVDPPVMQPPPIAVLWAPPPLLVEVPPLMPFAGAVWVGGYWTWEGTWVWARGRWLAPPQPTYAWVQPYYEHRGGTVVFISGHWAPAGVAFVPPPPGLRIAVAVAAPGVVPGPAPMGPVGVFIPPPPGSRPGLIVPAPIGTPPAVVTSAPPIVNVGMRVTVNNNNMTVNTTNVINNVTIVAPPSATANGQAVNALVPAQAHLAATLPPVVHAMAPEPASARPIPAYSANRAPFSLPAPQTVLPVAAPAMQRGAAPATPPAAYQTPPIQTPTPALNPPSTRQNPDTSQAPAPLQQPRLEQHDRTQQAPPQRSAQQTPAYPPRAGGQVVTPPQGAERWKLDQQSAQQQLRLDRRRTAQPRSAAESPSAEQRRAVPNQAAQARAQHPRPDPRDAERRRAMKEKQERDARDHRGESQR